MSARLTVTREITLVEMCCGECDITFAVPDYFQRECQETGRGWYCPNGHSRVYRTTDIEKLRKETERLRNSITHLRDQAEAAERSNRALRAASTRTKKRVGNGVCPCCNRSFTNVRRHMTSKHPDYKDAATP